MFNRVKSISAEADFKLSVEFENGVKKNYDVKPLFDKWEAFHALQYTPGLFTQVKVDTGGYGVSWNDDIDLSCDELWQNGSAEDQK